MRLLISNLWRTAAHFALWTIVFFILLLGGVTFNTVENPLARTLGIGLIFFATIFTALIWSGRQDGPRAAPLSEKVVGWTACLLLALTVFLAGLLIFSEDSFHTVLGVWTNQGMVFITLLLVPAMALGFFSRHTLPGQCALIAGSVATLAWLLWVGLVLVGFLLEPSRVPNP
jgi:hypothetical protein